jgi:DNA-binding NarL/FixJ family response regulator
MIRVAIVDDQTLVRQGIRSLLALSNEIDVVAEASDGDEALAVLDAHDVDVLLLDLRMPRRDGIATLEALRARGNHVPVLVLTTFDDDELALGALRAGARGYLLKDVTLDQLVGAIRTVATGGALLHPPSPTGSCAPCPNTPAQSRASTGPTPSPTASSTPCDWWPLATRTARSPPPCTSPRHRQEPRLPRPTQTRRPRPHPRRAAGPGPRPTRPHLISLPARHHLIGVHVCRLAAIRPARAPLCTRRLGPKVCSTDRHLPRT